MASVETVIHVTHDNDVLLSDPDAGARRDNMLRVIKFLRGCQIGSNSATTMEIMTGTSVAYASGTVTMAGAFSNADTITIGGQALTAATSPSGETQFALGSNAATAAANLAACINALTVATPILFGAVTASAASGVCTITATLPGRVGNAITLAKSATNATVSGANLSGGAGTKNAFLFNENGSV